MLLLEIIQKLSQRHRAIDFETVPNRPHIVVKRASSGFFWLGEGVRVVGEVEVTVLITADVLEAKKRKKKSYIHRCVMGTKWSLKAMEN